MTTIGQDDILIKRQSPPYWWPDVNAMMQLFLAGAIVLIVSFILYQLLTGRVSLDQAQNNLLMILFGVVLACFKDVYAYTFGSSAGQKRQGELITKSMETKDKIIADNVTATAAVAAAAVTPASEVPAKIITTAPTDPSVTATTTTVTTEDPHK